MSRRWPCSPCCPCSPPSTVVSSCPCRRICRGGECAIIPGKWRGSPDGKLEKIRLRGHFVERLAPLAPRQP
ncbi:hypothetical protein BT69DRAFT_1357584 [Atractiella rhizophila]|nr:hypothetical protein BT69DRAFT_1357584 [Atractiella rhizophila]